MQITRRLDHVVIAARDLGGAARAYRDGLGFETRPGGRHTGRGSENALIRFGSDYLELIGIFDETMARQAGRGTLVDFLRRHEGGHIAYALSTDDIEAEAAHMHEAGLDCLGPFAMERIRPDGSRLTWRLLWPGGDAYRRPWPFFIQWDGPIEERLAKEPPGAHPNGARGVVEVAVIVSSLEGGIDLYRRQLDLPFGGRAAVTELGASSATFELQDCRLVLLAPSGPGPVAEALDESGEGVYEVVLRVDDLEVTRGWLAEHGSGLGPARGPATGLLIDPAAALGARIVLREA